MVFARFVAALVMAGWVALAASRPVILTTDCGADMDDQWALAHLVLSPEFDVRAVVTTHTGKFAALVESKSLPRHSTANKAATASMSGTTRSPGT